MVKQGLKYEQSDSKAIIISIMSLFSLKDLSDII